MQANQRPIDNEQKGNNSKTGHAGPKLSMMIVICCLVPLGLLLALSQIWYGAAASYTVLLLGSLMHLFMMGGRNKDQYEVSGAEANT